MVLEQAGDLDRTEPERLAAQPTADEQRGHHRQHECDRSDAHHDRQLTAYDVADFFSVIPTATSAITFPAGSRTGTTARTDGPSVPLYASVNERPCTAGAMCPM